MAEYLWIFWSFSLLGWVLERLFAAVTRSPRRRRRCLLPLPPSLRSGWPLYLWGGLTATSVEYIYHWWGETFLGVSFWDYTGVFGNFRGRVCLPFFLAWGLLLFPAVYLVTPPVVALADRVPIGVTWWLLLAFTADAVCSLRFLAVTHDLEALRAVIWPVSADR